MTLASDSPVERVTPDAALELIKARVERIALDIETDHRSGKKRSPTSDGVALAKRLRAALSVP